ncbi:ImpE/SciE family protein [Burkholderia sp. 8Y]|uniref:type VI secretion system accessory protein TagJ n=1 Tax=Burkholderia sp. 8Y TaxID=2653133 RepID=UPI0012F26A12|nr:type VI secretion system accessory protein TagJ [Burkholderia sp. 8Y]VXB38730.1 ImpE/SciE family protein [Burkholderia sp. 8Y]
MSTDTPNSTHAKPASQTTDEAIASLVNSIRREPAVAVHRWSLFQCFCVTGEWERAMQQLQVYGQLDASAERVVQTFRDLIRAERWRERVMAGTQQPAFIYDDAPGWMRSLIAALGCAAQGDTCAADRTREAALNGAPLVAGRTAGQAFEWIADSDSRLGPVCEFIAAGSYRWVALSDIARWRVRQPSSLIDLVWTPCTLTLLDGATLHGFVPARYPLSRDGVHASREALHTGRETVWEELGRTGVIGHGRKTWSTDAGDFSVFELSDCAFGQDATQDAAPLVDEESHQ